MTARERAGETVADLRTFPMSAKRYPRMPRRGRPRVTLVRAAIAKGAERGACPCGRTLLVLEPWAPVNVGEYGHPAEPTKCEACARAQRGAA